MNVLQNDPTNIKNARTIVILGRGPSTKNAQLLTLLGEARKSGAKVVLITSDKGSAASYCDALLRISPGSDAALALAAANLIASWGMIDRQFVAHRSIGYEAFRAGAFSWNPEKTSAITGLSVAQIEGFSRLLLRRPTCFLLDCGIRPDERAGDTVAAIDALGAMIGSIGVKGGGVNFVLTPSGKFHFRYGLIEDDNGQPVFRKGV